MIVKSRVADVRAQPVPSSGTYQYDPLEETQVERGEPVSVLKREGRWVQVECIEQPEFTHHAKWEGYPGWMELKDLTPRLSAQKKIEKLQLPPGELRRKIIEMASQHLGTSYLWGGRSLHNPRIRNVATGVDCSGLVHWSFRRVGWIVPRDAHEQFMQARKLEPSQLKAGDLIFLAKADHPDKIVHVALYAGDGMIVEAPQTGETVRRISVRDRFGKDLPDLSSGTAVGDRVIYFGTFFSEGS